MTEKRLDTFVVADDQELLLQAEAQGRYRHLSEPRYLFVGDGKTSRLADRDDVIIARDLHHHLGDRPQLPALVAWHAIARNDLASAPFVSMLEYDAALAPDFERSTLADLTFAPDAYLGYAPVPMSDARYAATDVPIAPALREAYGIELEALVRNLLESTGTDLWNATTNMSCSRRALDEFVDWYLPIAETLGDDPLGDRVLERCIPVFGFLSGRETRSLRRLVTPGPFRNRSEGTATMLRPPGSRRLPVRPGDPALSVVVVAGTEIEPLLNLVWSLAPEQQDGVDAGEVELVVIDDGTQPRLDSNRIRNVSPSVRHFYRGAATPGVDAALDFGAEMARGERLGLIPSPTGLATPGLLRWASRAVDHFEDSLVRVPVTPTPERPRRSVDRDPIFCTRPRFVDLGGAAGLAAPPPDRNGVSFVALSGESIAANGGRGSTDDTEVHFGPVSATSPEELEYALLVAADRERQLAELRASRSWRLTRPVRGLSGVIRALTPRR